MMMRRRREAGFNLIELVMVLAVAVLALLALYRSYNYGIMRAVMGATVTRARDVYVALSAERFDTLEPEGWPGVLRPEDAPNAAARTAADFENSTELFRALIESGRCKGLTYDSLVSGGVTAGRSGAFSASNNIWTVAVNVSEESPDSLPLLISRNVDLAPLAAQPWEEVCKQRIAFDAVWGAPFYDSGFVVIRKGGALFTCRSKHVTYGFLFPSGAPTNSAAGGAGGPERRPLTYLTPTRAIIPAK